MLPDLSRPERLVSTFGNSKSFEPDVIRPTSDTGTYHLAACSKPPSVLIDFCPLRANSFQLTPI